MRYVNVTAASHPRLHLVIAWGGQGCGHYFPLPAGHRATVWRLYGVSAARVDRVEAALSGLSCVALAKAFNRGALPGRGVESLVESLVELNFDSGGWGGPCYTAYPMAASMRVYGHVWHRVVVRAPSINGGTPVEYVW